VIIASGDCFLGLLAWRLARHIGARFVFDVYDDYRAFGAYRIFSGFDAFGFLLRRASLVFYASRALALQHASSTPWTLLPNGVDPGTFKSKDRAAARAAVGLPDDGVSLVGYFGGMEAERGPADLVAAVGLLQSAESSIRLVLCGAAIPGLSLESPWVDYRGSVPHTTIPDYINACDVVALPYRRGPAIDMSSSCKIAEYLYCRRPIVATRTPNLIENFPEQASELGEAMCEPGDPADLARAIHAQLQHPVIASVPQEHSWEGIAMRALNELLDPSRSLAFIPPIRPAGRQR
jgi:glycosyltransferase involved in cell wall biosynthesis